MKKILGLVLAALVVMAGIGGATWASFNDTETSTGNTITAGTLNLTADTTGSGTVAGTKTPGADGANEYLTIANAKPGDSGVITFTLANTGSLAGHLTIVATQASPENGVGEPELAAGDTADNGATDGEMSTIGLEFTMTRDGTPVDLNGGTAGGTVFDAVALVGYFNGITGGNADALAAAGAGDTVTYALSWSIPSAVIGAGADDLFDVTADNTNPDDNIIQSDGMDLGLTFTLNQG